MNLCSIRMPANREQSMERRIDRTAETRDRIERAALKLFVEQGIKETSISSIAKEAGISQGAMYNHFKSKDELSQYLFDSVLNDFSKELSRIAGSAMPFPARIEQMISYFYRRFDEDRLLASFLCTSRLRYFMRTPDHPGNPLLIFRRLIADAVDKKEIPPGAVDLKAALLVGAVVQVVDSALVGRFKGALGQLAPAAASLCVRMVS